MSEENDSAANDNPANVLLTAYSSLAAGEFDIVIDLIDSAALPRIHEARIALAHALVEQTYGDRSNLAAYLKESGVASIEELETLSDKEVLLRGLNNLPSVRSEVRCKTLSHVIDAPAHALVDFQVYWNTSVTDAAPVQRATLLKRTVGWRVRPSLVNPWVLPGLENRLFFQMPG
jgi:hypothetical protein